MNVTLEIQQTFLRRHPKEASRWVQGLPHGRIAGLLANLEPEEIGRVLEYFIPRQGSDILKQFSDESRAVVLMALPSGLARSIFRFFNPDEQTSTLFYIKTSMRSSFRQAMKYTSARMGSLVDLNVLTLSIDDSVAEAFARISAEKPNLKTYLYVLDHDSRLSGVVSLKNLLGLPSDIPIREVMIAPVLTLPAESDARDLLTHPAWNAYDMLPIVEFGNQYLGALRYCTLRKSLEVTRDEPQAGSLSDALLQLWETYAISGMEMMTTVGDLFQTETVRQSIRQKRNDHDPHTSA